MVVQTVLVGGVVERSSMRLREACFRHCLSLDQFTLSEIGSSQLTARLTNDVKQLSAGLHVFGVRLIREPLKALVCLSLAFVWNWRLSLLSLVFAPIIAIMIGYCGKLLKRASRSAMQSLSAIYQVVGETFQNAKIVIAFDGGRRQRRLFHEQNKDLFYNSMRGIRIGALIRPANEVLGVFAAIAAILPAMYMVFRGTNEVWGIRLAATPMELADVALLYAFLAGTLDPVHKLSGIYSDWKKASAAADRVFEVLDLQTRVCEPIDPIPLPQHRGSVRFNGVSFAYSGNDQMSLRDVTLEVAAGEVVAIVGPNGCGKSTLVNLLMRFADPVCGSVQVSDLDITKVSLRDLRSQIGLVMQETLLFDASVRDNIQYGDELADLARIEESAEAAHVTRFLAQLPDGFDSGVGENGTRLSGGQRQRIALARALVRDPSILILDEATSAIDANSEALIFKSLRSCCAGRTVFIVAHALGPALLDLVDRIVVMEAGAIVAEGTHNELSTSCAVYATLNKSHTLPLAG